MWGPILRIDYLPILGLRPSSRRALHDPPLKFGPANADDAGAGFEGSQFAVSDPFFEETSGATDQIGCFRKGHKFAHHGSLRARECVSKLNSRGRFNAMPRPEFPIRFHGKRATVGVSHPPRHCGYVDPRFYHSRGI